MEWTGRRDPPQVGDAVAGRLDALVAAFDATLDAFNSWTQDGGWEATQGSPYEDERRRALRQFGPTGPWSDEDLVNARAIACMLVSVAGQHLEGLRSLVMARQLFLPHYAVVRSAAEACGWASWLLDPQPSSCSLSIRDRVARARLAWLDDISRAQTVARAARLPNLEEARLRVERLRQEQIPAAFYPSEIQRLSSGTIQLRGQSTPGLRDSLSYISKVHDLGWNTDAVYALLSNLAHPTPHSFFSMAKRFDGGLKFHLDDASQPIDSLLFAGSSFLFTWSLIAQYLGHGAEEIRKLQETYQLV